MIEFDVVSHEEVSHSDGYMLEISLLGSNTSLDVSNSREKTEIYSFSNNELSAGHLRLSQMGRHITVNCFQPEVGFTVKLHCSCTVLNNVECCAVLCCIMLFLTVVYTSVLYTHRF